MPRLRIANIGLLCAVIAIASCRHVPPAPIDPGANARRLAARSLDNPAVKAALTSYGLTMPASSSWSLDQLTIAAWTLRPDVALARSEVEAAKANIVVQGKRPNPTLSLSPERVIANAAGANPWVIATTMTLPIETAGKRGIRRAKAQAMERAAEWQLGTALWSARASVRAALLARDLAAKTVALDDREAGLRAAYRDWIETRIKFGAATSQDRLVATQALAAVESRRGTDRASLAAATATLATAVGLRPDSFAAVSPSYPNLGTLPDFTEADLAKMRDAALVNRTDIRRSLAEYDVAEQDLKAAVAKQYPDIGFGPGYLFDQGAHKITLTVDFPVPLFDNGSAAINAAVAARKVAAARFDDVQAAALGAIDSSFARYQATLKAVAAARDAEAEARRNYETVNRVLKAGGGDRGSQLTAEIDLVTRLRNTLVAESGAVDAVTALENAVERPVFPPSSLQTVGAVAETSHEATP